MTGVLDGKVAAVTGTSRGVGVGIAHELLCAGATVVGCSRSALDALPGASDNAESASRSSQLICDQGDLHSIDDFITDVVDTHGRLDILVNTVAARAYVDALILGPEGSGVNAIGFRRRRRCALPTVGGSASGSSPRSTDHGGSLI